MVDKKAANLGVHPPKAGQEHTQPTPENAQTDSLASQTDAIFEIAQQIATPQSPADSFFVFDTAAIDAEASQSPPTSSGRSAKRNHDSAVETSTEAPEASEETALKLGQLLSHHEGELVVQLVVPDALSDSLSIVGNDGANVERDGNLFVISGSKEAVSGTLNAIRVELESYSAPMQFNVRISSGQDINTRLNLFMDMDNAGLFQIRPSGSSDGSTRLAISSLQIKAPGEAGASDVSVPAITQSSYRIELPHFSNAASTTTSETNDDTDDSGRFANNFTLSFAEEIDTELSFTEDASPLALPAIVIDASEASTDALTVTLALSNAALGSLYVDSTDDTTFTDAGGGRYTLEGNADEVNTLLSAIRLTPATNAYGSSNLQIVVRNGSETPISETILLTASPVNDAITDITLSNGNISEGSGTGTVIGTLSAEDVDTGDTHRFVILSDPDSKFSLSGNQLTLSDTVDYETASTHSVTIRATDSGGETYTKTLTITINNAAPGIIADGNGATNQILENATNGASTGLRVTATDDQDGGTISYSLSDDAGGRFTIDSSTGIVTLANASLIDYETATSHQITVVASDGSLTSSQNFTIAVANVAPGGISDNDGTANTLSETASNGTTVGITALASDPSGGTISYSLSDDAGGRFAINSTTGVISVSDASLLDYESATSHQVTVVASDGNLTSTQNFTITITDVDEAPTANADTLSLNEDGSLTFSRADLLANDTDPEDGTPSWDSINLTVSNGTLVDNSDGTYTYTPNADWFGNETISYTVIDSNSVTNTANVTITTTSVNDTPTVAQELIDQGGSPSVAFSYTFDAASFDDVDISTGDALTYTATLSGGGALPGWLSFDAATRTFAFSAGAGVFGVYTIDVTATDTGSASITDSFTLTVSSVPLVGDSLNNLIYGDSSDNIITGLEGNDTLYGGAGNDSLFGNENNDRLYGEADNDSLIGYSGSDTLYGGDGNDTLDGGSHNDLLYGDDGIDQIDGGDGADQIDGGLGADIITGGSGNDIFLYYDPATTSTATDTDVITDFTPGQDLIRIVGYTAITSGAASGTTLSYSFDGTHTVITNADNSFTLKLLGNISLSASNFNFLSQLGTSGADTMTGTGGLDGILGLDGDDVIDAGGGTDLVWGGTGNDTIDGGDHNDTLYGDDGDDYIFGGEGLGGRRRYNLLDGGDGSDTLVGGQAADTLTGGAGADYFTYRYGIESYHTNPIYYDVITDFTPGTDKIRFEGSLFNGIAAGAASGTTLGYSYDAGTDTTIITSAAPYHAFTAFRIVLNGNHTLSASDFEFSGFTLGTSGDDTINGTASGDGINADAGNDTVYGGDGIDNIFGNAGDDSIEGGAGDDIITDNAGLNTIRGDDGDDSIYAGVDNDVLYGGAGNDTIRGYNGNDTIYGDADNDYLTGNQGDDELHGGDGNDLFDLTYGDDLVYGDDGNDTFQYITGEDTIYTGLGNDRIYSLYWYRNMQHNNYDEPGITVIEDFDAGNDHFYFHTMGVNAYNAASAGYAEISSYYDAVDDVTVVHDEHMDIVYHLRGNITLSASNFIFTSNTNDLTGTAAADNFTGRTYDQILGYGGNDTLSGGSGGGWDLIRGGDGNDLISVTYAGALYGDAGDDTITGGSNRNLIRGGTGNDQIDGNNNRDTIYGGDDNDQINGLGNADSIWGDAGDDTIDAGAGNDTIDGGAGQDVLTGGTNSDVFVFTALTDSTNTQTDRITDFEDGSDMITVTGLGFSDISDFDVFSYNSGTNVTLLHDTGTNFAIEFDGDLTALLTNADFNF